MCMSIPGKILQLLENNMAIVDYMGTQKKAVLEMLDNPQVGDYIIVSAGYALYTISAEDAKERMSYIVEMQNNLEKDTQ